MLQLCKYTCTSKFSCLLHNSFTIPGYDYTGRSSSAKSEGIVIDATAPIKSNQEISIGARYITDLSYVEAWYAKHYISTNKDQTYDYGLMNKNQTHCV